MEKWIFFGIVAALLVGIRDFLTKTFVDKYTSTQHLLHYYIITSIFLILFALFRKYQLHESNLTLVDQEDLWKYILIGLFTAVIISPCQVLSIKYCKQPSRSTALQSLSSVVLFFLTLYLTHKATFDLKIFMGIILIGVGVFLIM